MKHPRLKAKPMAFVRLTGRGAVYLFGGLLTLLLLANSYEIAFGRTLPLIHAVTNINVAFIQPDINKTANLTKQTTTDYEGNYGAPLQLKVGTTPVRIPVAAPVHRGNEWLARASTAHYVILSPSQNGDIGNILVYMTAGSTTIRPDAQIKAGDNIALDTKRDWRYFYRVDEVATLHDGQQFVLPSSSSARLYIVVQESGSAHMVITATLTNVQNADQ